MGRAAGSDGGRRRAGELIGFHHGHVLHAGDTGIAGERGRGRRTPETGVEHQAVRKRLAAELKGGVKLPYTSLNGNMYTQLTKAGKVGLRMGKADREAFIEKYDATLLTSYGAVMKEYVEVPDSLLSQTDELAPYLAISYSYVQTLKPKPSKKTKK